MERSYYLLDYGVDGEYLDKETINCLFFFAHSFPNHPGPATVVCYQTKQDTRILILDDDGAGDDIEVDDTLSGHVR